MSPAVHESGIPMLMVRVGGVSCAAELDRITRIESARVAPGDGGTGDGLVDMAGLLGLSDRSDAARWALIVAHGGRHIGLLVEQIEDQQLVPPQHFRPLPPIVRDTIKTRAVQGVIASGGAASERTAPRLVLDLGPCCEEGIAQRLEHATS